MESYSSVMEFRDKFSKQLEMRIRALAEQDQQSGDAQGVADNLPHLELALVDGVTGEPLGRDAHIQVERLVCTNEEEIPDYAPEKDKGGVKWGSFWTGSGGKDYLRDIVKYACQQSSLKALRIAVTNSGTGGARDLYIELIALKTDGGVAILTPAQVPKKPSMAPWFSIDLNPLQPGDLETTELASRWRVAVDIAAVQPKRTVATRGILYVAPSTSGRITMEATLYADCFPKPISVPLSLAITVTEKKATYDAIIRSIADSDSESGNNG